MLVIERQRFPFSTFKFPWLLSTINFTCLIILYNFSNFKFRITKKQICLSFYCPNQLISKRYYFTHISYFTLSLWPLHHQHKIIPGFLVCMGACWSVIFPITIHKNTFSNLIRIILVALLNRSSKQPLDEHVSH